MLEHCQRWFDEQNTSIETVRRKYIRCRSKVSFQRKDLTQTGENETVCIDIENLVKLGQSPNVQLCVLTSLPCARTLIGLQ